MKGKISIELHLQHIINRSGGTVSGIVIIINYKNKNN